MKRPLIKVMSEDEYRDRSQDYSGLCLACGDISEGGVEPDVEHYECGACGERRVVGLELALVMGRIEFEEDPSPQKPASPAEGLPPSATGSMGLTATPQKTVTFLPASTFPKLEIGDPE